MHDKQKPKLGDPREYIRDITRGNEYLEGAQGIRESRQRARLIARIAAKQYSGESEHYKNIDVLSQDLFSVSFPFLEASIELDRNDDSHHLSYGEKKEFKRDTIRFNHTVREIFDSHPHISEEDITRFVVQTQLMLRGKEWAMYARSRTKEAITGMIMEIAYEDALWNVPGVESVMHADMEQELKGVDLIILFEDGDSLPIDVKTSARGLYEAQKQGNLAVKSPFSLEDIRKRRVIPARLHDELPGITDTIYELKKLNQGGYAYNVSSR